MLQVRTQQWYADAQRHANALAARFHGQSAERRIDVFVEMQGWEAETIGLSWKPAGTRSLF